MPPILTTGSGDSIPDCVADPLTIGTFVAPNPFANIDTVSPGFAGMEVSRLPSACCAATYGPPLMTKNDGDSGRA